MADVLIIEPNDEKKIEEFAKIAGISIQQAKFIDHLRSRYIAHEYDYVKKPLEIVEVR